MAIRSISVNYFLPACRLSQVATQSTTASSGRDHRSTAGPSRKAASGSRIFSASTLAFYWFGGIGLLLGTMHSAALAQQTGRVGDQNAPSNSNANPLNPGGQVGGQEGVAAPPITNLKQKASYVIGRQIMTDFMRDQVDLDLDALVQGIKDAAEQKDSPMPLEEIRAVMEAFSKQIQARQQQILQEMADRNLKEGQAYLQQNATKPGVKQLENGVQYEVLTEGTGPSPTATDWVTVHYVGTLIDGTVFDSSITRGQAANYPLGKDVIEGWTATIPRMKVGSKWRIVIPSKLAFKETGSPPAIEPNKTLIFEIELLGIGQK